MSDRDGRLRRLMVRCNDVRDATVRRDAGSGLLEVALGLRHLATLRSAGAARLIMAVTVKVTTGASTTAQAVALSVIAALGASGMVGAWWLGRTVDGLLDEFTAALDDCIDDERVASRLDREMLARF